MSKHTVHLICNAHLDPVWQWRWTEGCSEAIATFRNAVEILHDYKDLIFNHNEALLYQWVQKYDPQLFKEIRLLVKRGRWCIGGGWYLQPDLNLPGTESLIRQILTGKKYFREYFNSNPEVAYNFDSFGHSAGLPQILRQTGYKMYIHQRPEKKFLELPDDLYSWKGVDGSSIPAYRIETGLYHTERTNIKARLRQGVQLALKKERDVAVFWGLGDHGGGATRDDLEKIREFISEEKSVGFIHSTPDNLYESLKEKLKKQPVFEGGLQKVFTGCYTSASRIKRKAIECSSLTIQSEILRALAWWNFGLEYPHKEFDEIWNDLLFNDFHDILPGTCTEKAEQDALNLYGKTSESIKKLNLEAAAFINRNIAVNDVYIPLCVINTNTGMNSFPVEFECMFDYRPPWKAKWQLELTDLEGERILCQEEQADALLPFNNWRRKISFIAEADGIGTKFYQLKAIKEKPENKTINISSDYIINKNSGLLNEIFDTEKNQYLKGDLFKPLVIKDTADSWGTDTDKYRTVDGVFALIPESIRLIENGPVRSVLESVMVYNSSKIVYHTIFYNSLSFIEVRLRIYWNEERKRLKLSVPVTMNQTELLCEISGGTIARPCDGKEHVHGKWMIVSGRIKEQECAMAIANSGQHGFDFINGELRLSVLRSAAYCHEKGFNIEGRQYRNFMDMGVHDVRFVITFGNPEEIKLKIPGLTNWLNAPPLPYPHLPYGTVSKIEIQEEKKENFSGLLSISPENITLLSIRPGHDNDALIIRLQETIGIPSSAEINLAGLAKKIKEKFSAFQIKTIIINRQGVIRKTKTIM